MAEAPPPGSLGAPLVDAHVHVFRADMPVAKGAWTRLDRRVHGRAAGRAHWMRMVFATPSFPALASPAPITIMSSPLSPAPTSVLRVARQSSIPAPIFTSLEKMKADGIVGVRLQLARSVDLPDFRSDDWRRPPGTRARSRLACAYRAGGTALPADIGRHCWKAAPRSSSITSAIPIPPIRLAGRAIGRWSPASIRAGSGSSSPPASVWPERRPTRTRQAIFDSIADRVAADLIARVGTDRLLWGSDAPFVGYENRVDYDRVLASYDRWVPDPRVRAEIDRTALHLYFAQ